MKLYKIFKILFVISLCTLSASCIGEKEMEVIYYESEEFDDYVKNKAKISPMEAWSLNQQFRKKKYGREGGGGIFFIVNDNYVFPKYKRLKIPDARLTGIWVNTQTGETKYVVNNTILKPRTFYGWKGNEK